MLCLDFPIKKLPNDPSDSFMLPGPEFLFLFSNIMWKEPFIPDEQENCPYDFRSVPLSSNDPSHSILSFPMLEYMPLDRANSDPADVWSKYPLNKYVDQPRPPRLGGLKITPIAGNVFES